MQWLRMFQKSAVTEKNGGRDNSLQILAGDPQKSNLKSEISNLRFQISDFKFQNPTPPANIFTQPLIDAPVGRTAAILYNRAIP
jgi:hypothetical protein